MLSLHVLDSSYLTANSIHRVNHRGKFDIALLLFYRLEKSHNTMVILILQ